MIRNVDAGKTLSLLFYSSVAHGLGDKRIAALFCTIAVVFGCLHLIPIWASYFPSDHEAILWKVSAFMISIHPALLLCWLVCCGWIEERSKLIYYSFGFVITVLGFFMYLIARLVLIILAFTTLRNLPRGAYQNVAWTTFLPHW
ncbi:hypothetical protein P691DRAFT_674942 [Macrolepiota fuliginosa MF-IS2]|uniref:Uncharacterized protein n=1 Tax=Macrolepiota fuliginosa MF-IS2 TaxID=1400762 RepID=A0A9P5X9D2_9AGAR|nr:hypothetical protein P691DRAFT_674942 [Macrolepiota fuliginosa MF-IS2]